MARLSGESIEAFVESAGTSLLACARRYSRTGADAEDAFQRSLEVLLTKPAPVDPDRRLSWMLTVVKNEALMIQRRESRTVDAAFEEVASDWASTDEGPAEAAESSARLEIERESLKRLRPDQVRCLLLRADGFGYPEICAITGFSYARVNRLLSEGRKNIRAQVDRIESGAECSRLASSLGAIAEGGSGRYDAEDVRSHVEHCAACQATLRDYLRAPALTEETLQPGLGDDTLVDVRDALEDGASSTGIERGAGPSVGFASTIERIKRALSVSEIALIVGVKDRQVHHWASGTHRPTGSKKSTLLELHAIVDELMNSLDGEAADIWLHTPESSAGDRPPIELLLDGQFAEVRSLVRKDVPRSSDELRLVERAQRGSDAARRTLIQRYLPFIASKSSSYEKLTPEDVEIAGTTGLSNAIHRFDTASSTDFRPFAESAIVRQLLASAIAEVAASEMGTNEATSGKGSSPETTSLRPTLGRAPGSIIDLMSAMEIFTPESDSSVLVMVIEGQSKSAIAEKMGEDVEEIDRALLRIRTAIDQLLTSRQAASVA